MEPLAATAVVSPKRVHGQSRLTETEVLEHAYGIPTLHGWGDSQPFLERPTKQNRPELRHGRSKSHPFPSLFQSKGKRQEGGSSSTINPARENKPSPATQSSPRAATGRASRVPDKDLTTGNCMTCNSTVRWPKELLVFRCTVCLTINDLKPTSANRELGVGLGSGLSMSFDMTRDSISPKGTNSPP